MPQPDRRPPVKMERRDIRITVRYTESESARLTEHAIASGDEVSRYIRKCSLMGDSVTQAVPLLKATGA